MPLPPKLHKIFVAYWRAFSSYTPEIVLISVLAVIASVFEGLSITAIIPIFSFVGGNAASGLPTDMISQFIAASYHFINVPYTFKNLLIGIALLFVVRTLLLFGIQFITGRIVYGYEQDTRRKLFNAMLSAQWPYLSRQNMGNLEQLLTTNIIYASQIFGSISTAIMIGSKTLMYVVIAVNVSPWVALLSLVVGGSVFLLLRPLFYRTRIIAMQAESSNRALAHFTAEHVGGMKALKAMAVEDEVEKSADSYFERIRRFNIDILLLRSLIQMTIQFAGVAFIGAVFVVMYKSPGFSVAAFAVIVYAINQIFSQVQTGQSQLHGLGSMTPYLLSIITTRDEAQRHAEESHGEEPFRITHSIAFRDVSFSYAERSAVLSDLSFELPRGALVALIGPSGAGKTTVADLVLRLIDPTSGLIQADGLDVREIPVRQWRKHIGYVPQDPIILNDTIARNISFYDDSITHEEVERAARAANIHEFIETLPKKYDTKLGDRGILISGGQRQRIALARALARKPELLVLDEATSALDSESELAIKQSVEHLKGKTTVLVIAHRMSSISGADHIVVLEKGQVVEQGSPAALRARADSYYARILKAGVTEL
ncbi:MAG TPA: ABC transporter ATP-binding protein [Candidatus Paceibacterota bacterium]|nr:ABC transporter ATP-binding protein [Candidatus Paceibacterota bacterium]